MNSAIKKYTAATSKGMVSTRRRALPKANRLMAPSALLSGANIQVIGFGTGDAQRKVGQRIGGLGADAPGGGRVSKDPESPSIRSLRSVDVSSETPAVAPLSNAKISAAPKPPERPDSNRTGPSIRSSFWLKTRETPCSRPPNRSWRPRPETLPWRWRRSTRPGYRSAPPAWPRHRCRGCLPESRSWSSLACRPFR